MSIIDSYLNAINPLNSLNLVRTGEYRYNERALQRLAPKSKEILINAYNGLLELPEPDSFEENVKTYLTSQEETLNKHISANEPLTSEQLEKHQILTESLTNLKKELQIFTREIKRLPANTHAEALANIAQEERNTVLLKIKDLNKETQTLIRNLTTKQSNNQTTPSTPSTASSAEENTSAGTVSGRILTPDETAAISSKASAMEEALKQTDDEVTNPEFEALEKKLTDIISNMRRAAQLERDRIPLFATLTANKRKQQLFSSMLNNMNNPFSLFSTIKGTPYSVHMTGKEQETVSKLQNAMRTVGLTNLALNEAKENLEKAKAGLKEATDKNNEENKKKYNDEIAACNIEINTLSEQLAQGAQSAEQELKGKDGYFFGLIGYDPGLTSLSGQKITPTVSGQGELGFKIDFPAPIFDPFYYTSGEHNTKADLVCMAELVKATGAKGITTTISSGWLSNPKREHRLAQEAWEAALEAGFDEDKITIVFGGKIITKENITELYQDIDKQTGKDTGKHAAKQQRAQASKQTADQARAEVKAAQAPQIKQQQEALKHALGAGRNKLSETVTNDLDAPPSQQPTNPL